MRLREVGLQLDFRTDPYVADGLIVHPVNNSISTMPDKGADYEQ